MPKSLFRRFTKKFLIVCNFIVAIFFLMGVYSKWLYTGSLWPIGFLSLGAFYFLILLILFMCFWLVIKARWSLITIITIILAIGPIRQIVPFRLSSSFSKLKDSSDLRVMSWNVAQFDVLEYKKDPGVYNHMIDLINDYKPDIACFQEMVSADTLVNLNTAYYKKYGFYPIYAFLEQLHFPQHFYSYNFKEDYLANQHFGIVIFSKYPIINKQTVSYYPHDYNSIFQYVDIVKNGDTVRIFNLHLQSLKFSPDNYQYLDKPTLESAKDVQKSRNLIGKFKLGFTKRQVQSDRIRSAIKESPYPVVVCGDFNDVPNSYAYSTIGSGLQNAFVEKGSGLGRTFSSIAPTLRIDHIFTDKRYAVTQFTRVAEKLSDHFPIVADIKLR